MTSTSLFALRALQRAFAPRVKQVRQAFSMVEMLVALAVFLVLLTAVFVPIKLAGDLSGVGISRASTQQAAIDGIRQIKSDINKAIVILPNDRMAGVTDVYPYTAIGGFPFLRDSAAYTIPSDKDKADGTSNPNACRGMASVAGAPNTARLDLILPANGNNASNTIDPNIRHNSVLISYYARRRDVAKAFDPIENPVVLYRAQIPFQYVDPAKGARPFPAWGTPDSFATPPVPPFNADLSNQRFAPLASMSTCTPAAARSLKWLTMNQYGEFDLGGVALPPAGSPPKSTTAPPVFGSHQLVLPRDMALLTPNAASDTTATPVPNMSLVPDTTFICSDANKDGKIDTVTIQLSVGQYDENSVNRRSSNQPGKPSILVPQIARTVTETVFDPNVQ